MPQIDLKVKNGMQEVQNHVKEEISNFGSEHDRDLILASNPGFWVWGIIWDHFHKPKIDLKVKNGMQEIQTNSKE